MQIIRQEAPTAADQKDNDRSNEECERFYYERQQKNLQTIKELMNMNRGAVI